MVLTGNETDSGRPGSVDSDGYSTDEESLKCFDCDVSFTTKYYLYNHLLHHVKQPQILIKRVKEPIKITLKNRNNGFEIISSPQASPKITEKLETVDSADNPNPMLEDLGLTKAKIEEIDEPEEDETNEEISNVSFSPNFVSESDVSEKDETAAEQQTDMLAMDIEKPAEYTNIPGAEPTPPPEPSPEYPKIRIKTSGLLKESLTITEITDDNPNGDYIPPPEIINFNNQLEQQNQIEHNNYGSWATPSLEDPLRLPDLSENDSSILSNLFSSNNDRAKDLGFTTSDTEFINLDRIDTRGSSNALQVYNSQNSMVATNPLDNLTNLPMQQLAQQVSRLQPNGNNGMHQQNVLINIQQFPQAPQQQHTYQPHMYPPHPPQPMYHQPYQYQPPNPYMAYPPQPAYGQHMPPPPRPQMPPQLPQPTQQMPQQQQQQQQQQQHPTTQPHQYRQPAPPRAPQPIQPRPQQQQQGQRAPMQPRGGQQMAPRQFNPRQPMQQQRQRAPMIRGRGGVMMGQRGPRPRMPMQGSQQMQQQNGPRMIKRSPESIQAMQAKKRKMDILVPDKNDDGDCEVIAVQPKNTGLPQIQSIQGNVADPVDNSIMHLSDSITLSVRNPPPKPASPKKSDAKAVANILATRGITVTASPKSNKEISKSSSKSPEPAPPVAINLNSSVCIIPTKTGSNKSDKLATVDLTDDTPDPAPQQKMSPQKPVNNKVLPFQCDLCPAKYPNSLSLNKHRQTYHKTGPNGDYGIPLIDLKTPGITQRLASLGIYNYIPLPNANAQSTFALPIISANAAQKNTNLNSIGATSVLTLGPIRTFPKSTQNNHK